MILYPLNAPDGRPQRLKYILINMVVRRRHHVRAMMSRRRT